MSTDQNYIQHALKLALLGRYSARPNPVVGCVLVKNQRMIGQGFHPEAGQPHAEVFALKHAHSAGFDPKGATAYVTLEPCAHTGRTPPCALALIEAGVSRVVIGTLDTNPKVAGGGVKLLTDAGVSVSTGVLQAQAQQQNASFLKHMKEGKATLTAKLGMSLDAKVAMSSGESKWITSKESRADVQGVRAQSAALITGAGTISADNPRLNVRSTELYSAEELALAKSLPQPLPQPKQPLVVVLDRQASAFDPDLNLLKTGAPVWWVTSQPSSGLQRYALEHEHLSMVDYTSLAALKERLSEHGAYNLMLEAGARLTNAFLDQGLVDQLLIYTAPKVLGVSARSAFSAELTELKQAKDFELQEVSQVGPDLKMLLRPVN